MTPNEALKLTIAYYDSSPHPEMIAAWMVRLLAHNYKAVSEALNSIHGPVSIERLVEKLEELR